MADKGLSDLGAYCCLAGDRYLVTALLLRRHGVVAQRFKLIAELSAGCCGRRDVPVHLVAGEHDGVIPASNVRYHYAAMSAAGMDVSYRQFDFGHMDFTFSAKVGAADGHWGAAGQQGWGP